MGYKTDFFKKEGSPEKLSKLRKKDRETSINEDLKNVNPRLSKHQMGKTRNCMSCTLAMEMRRRGYDVQARSEGSGYSTEEFQKWYKGVKIKKPKWENEEGEKRKDKRQNQSYV